MMLEGKIAIVAGSGSGVGRASCAAVRRGGRAGRLRRHQPRPGQGDSQPDRGRRRHRDGRAVRRLAGAGCRGCDRAGGRAVRPAGHHVQQRRDPDPAARAEFEDHTVEDFDRLTAVNFRGVFLGSKHAVHAVQEAGGGGVIVNTGSVAGLVGWGGSVYGATKGAVHQLTRAVAIEGAPFGIRANAICPAGMPYTGFMAAGGMRHLARCRLTRQQIAQSRRACHPLGRPITAEDCAEAAVFLCLGPGQEHHRRAAARRRRVRRAMSTLPCLDARPRAGARAVRPA